jgi:hypothetical protein
MLTIVARLVQPPSVRHLGKEFLDGAQISFEMMIGQPVEIAEDMKNAGRAAMCMLDPFRFAGEQAFLGYPGRLLFREISLAIHESEFSHVLVAPTERKMWNQIVVINEPIIGYGIGVAKRPIAYAR